MSDQGIETSWRKEKKKMLLLNNAVLGEYNHIQGCCIITLQKNE